MYVLCIWWKFKIKKRFVSHLYASEESLVDRKILKAHICEDPPETTEMTFACQERADAAQHAQLATQGCMKASKSGSPLANSPPSKRKDKTRQAQPIGIGCPA